MQKHHRIKRKYSNLKTRPHASKNNTHVQRKKNFLLKGLFLTLSIFTFSALTASAIFGAYVTQYTHDLPEINAETFKSVQTTGQTVILDRKGRELYRLTADKIIDFISLDKVGEYFKWSIIAVEDATFYQNDGVEFSAVVRALLNNQLNENGQKSGASTISQQTIKNLVVGSEQKTERKIKEAILAMELNRRYDKDKILEIYSNLVPMGGVNYGVKRAANLYFGKDPIDLSLAQAAYLAGIPQQPSEYAPPPVGQNQLVVLSDGSSISSGVVRQREVLDRLKVIKNQSGISLEQINAAYQEPLNFVLDFDKVQIKAPHFVNSVREQLATMYGSEENVRRANLTVTTSIDLDLQAVGEKYAKLMDSKLPSAYDSATGRWLPHLGAENLGIVTIDSRNGEVLTMVGSKDFFSQSSPDRKFDPQTNFTTNPRSMGSSMKPCMFLGYMSKNGATPSSITPNVTDRDGRSKLIFEGGYRPQNYTPIPNVKEDKLSLRSALQRSLNIPAIFAVSKLGLDNYADFCGELGYDQEEKEEIKKGLSTVLGAAGIKMVNHANTYATIANGGMRSNVISIIEVKDVNGTVIFTPDRAQRRVVDERSVKMLNSILVDYPFDSLTRFWNAGYYGRVAGKTGTNDGGIQRDNNGNPIQAWGGGYLSAPTDVTFAGYTSSLATVITVGNSNNYAIATSADGAAVATSVWSDYMLDIIGRFPTERL